MDIDLEHLDKLHRAPENRSRVEQACAVYVLHREDGLSFDAIAARLGMSKGKVFYLFWSMHRALDYRAFRGGGDEGELVWAFEFFFSLRDELGVDTYRKNKECLFAQISA